MKKGNRQIGKSVFVQLDDINADIFTALSTYETEDDMNAIFPNDNDMEDGDVEYVAELKVIAIHKKTMETKIEKIQ